MISSTRLPQFQGRTKAKASSYTFRAWRDGVRLNRDTATCVARLLIQLLLLLLFPSLLRSQLERNEQSGRSKSKSFSFGRTVSSRYGQKTTLMRKGRLYWPRPAFCTMKRGAYMSPFTCPGGILVTRPFLSRFSLSLRLVHLISTHFKTRTSFPRKWIQFVSLWQ